MPFGFKKIDLYETMNGGFSIQCSPVQYQKLLLTVLQGAYLFIFEGFCLWDVAELWNNKKGKNQLGPSNQKW